MAPFVYITRYTKSMAKKQKNGVSGGFVFFGIGVILAGLIFSYPGFHELISNLGEWGILGMFLAGLAFVVSQLSPIATVVMLGLSEEYPMWMVTLICGVGSMVGDLIMFRFFSSGLGADVFEEVENIKKRLHLRNKTLIKLLGAIFIVSPLPDEIGVALLGMSNVKIGNMAVLSFCLNSLAIFVLVYAYAVARGVV